MNKWGRSGRGALLVILLLLVSGAVIPLGTHGQGNVVSGLVYDCADQDPVGAQVFLVDAQAQLPERSTPANPPSGYFTFASVSPSYYTLRVQPDGFSHFSTTTSPPFRVDGITEVPPQRICVDKMPDKDRWLNVTVIDAATNSASETVTFQESQHDDENVTARGINGYDYTADNVLLATRPLAWGSETLIFVDNTTPIGGIPLSRPVDYDYVELDAFNGVIRINNPAVQTKLQNTLFNLPDRGWLEVTYRNASQSSRLSHGQISNAQFFKDGGPIIPYWSTVDLDNETGSLRVNVTNWRYGSGGNRLTATYDWSGAVKADVTVRYAPEDQPVAATITTTDSGANAGKAFFRVWDNDQFEVKVESQGYQTALQPVSFLGSDIALQIRMTRQYRVRAYAWEGSRAVTTAEGLTGALVESTGFVNKEVQVLRPVAVDNLLTFNAPNGTYRMIVDANGRKAVIQTVVVNGANLPPIDVFLQKSLMEPVTTQVAFKADNDWNNITVWRNFTLLPDSTFPGLKFPEVRDIHWQLDLNFGDRNGFLILPERDLFQLYLQRAGPFYVVTDTFFTVNGKAYNSTLFTVLSVVDAGPTANITVSTRTDYTLKDLATKAIAADQPRYYVNVTTIADRNVTVYQNQTVLVKLPRAYEMTSKTTTGNVVTRDFQQVTVDPGIDAVVPNPRANLIVDRSLTGVARAEVEGPIGKVYVKNADQDKYLAWVSNNTKVVFSANKTTDRQNQAVNAKDAKFNWTFRYVILNTSVKGWAEGIWTTFDFGSLGTDYTVNLTVTQVNPQNVTYRQFNLTVDNLNPNASFSTNRTTGDNPASLTVKEDLLTRFDGTKSSDLMWGATLKGEIAEWNWDFDHDGTVDRTGRVVTYNYSTPGSFFLNLSVVDRVGHKSLNQTLPVTVQDVSPPVVNLVILDENNSWREITQLTEGKGYWFNVSGTTDNSLENPQDAQNLSYRFDWGQGAANVQGPMPGTSFNLNLTHVYADHGEYKLSINVTDAAANHGYLNRTLVVQANTTDHPDLTIIAGTLKISPTSPEEGQATTFRLNLTNAKDKVNATDLQLNFSTIEKGRDVKQAVTGLRWLNPDGSTATRVEPGKNVTVEFKWTPPTLGNKSLRIKVWDGDEPTAWVTNANEVTTNLVVKEAGYKIWLWVGGFLFVIVGLPLIYYIVRKVRAGELGLPRRRKAEDADEDEDEEPEDDDEEGGGGKKRL